MIYFHSSVVAALTAFSFLGIIQATPLADKLNSITPSARNLLKRATPHPPHFVAYNDKSVSFPSASDLKGFNVFAISFLTDSGSVDQAQAWEQLSDDERSSHLTEYNSAGISLIVSAFGPSETPTSSGVDPSSSASTLANWVTQYGVNGIDIFYQDTDAFNAGTAESWLITLTQQLRAQLPEEQYILTHAPAASYFSPSKWSGGGYLAVEKSVGSLIDWHNVQFFNEGDSEYTTCDGLVTKSSQAVPKTAIYEIVRSGVSRDKIVVGKPATPADASNGGYMDPSTFEKCIVLATIAYWDGGVMAWQFPDADSSWIATVRGKVWPVNS